jgi:methylglyoxal synthase
MLLPGVSNFAMQLTEGDVLVLIFFRIPLRYQQEQPYP